MSKRIEVHDNFSKYNIDDWILKQILPENKEKILDLGCGTGKQLFHLISSCPDSEIFGLDLSDDALQKISSSVSDKNSNLKLILGNMDNFDSVLNSEKFNLIISCFALYYSENLPSLIEKIKKYLLPGGRFFICGPIEGNNSELIKFQSEIKASKKRNSPYLMNEVILPEIKNNFKEISSDIFVNPLSFPTPNSLIDYWKSYVLYEPNIEQEFIEKVKLHFSKNKTFVTTKKILGITSFV